MAYIRQIVRQDGREVTGWTSKSKGRPPARGKWEVVVSVGRNRAGRYRQVKRRLVGTYTAAKELGHKLETQTSGRSTDAATVTVGELIDRYIAHRRAIGRAPKTLAGYESIARKLLPRLGDLRLSRLTPQDLDAYYRELLDEGLSSATVAHHHAFISQALNQAVRWELADAPTSADKATPPPLERPEPTAPSPEEVRALIAAVRHQHPEMAALLYMAAVTGCRRGEVCAWRWSDFELGSGQLTVSRALSDAEGKVVVKRTKTKRARRMAIDLSATAVIGHLWERYVLHCEQLGIEPDRSTYVFSQVPDHSVPWRPDRVTHTFGRLRAREAARLEQEALAAGSSRSVAAAVRSRMMSVKLAQFRHFSATVMLGGGVDIRTASARTGHDGTVMLRHYAGVIPANDQAAAELLAGVLSQASETLQ